MARRTLRIITRIGSVLIAASLLIGCKNTLPTPTSEPSREMVVVTAAHWPSGTVVAIPHGTQGQMGNVLIGFSSTGEADYVDRSGVQQHGLTARILLHNQNDNLSEWLTVFIEQTFEFGGYTFCVVEIREANIKPEDPPGTIGGGRIQLVVNPK